MVEITTKFYEDHVWALIEVKSLFLDQFTETIDQFIVGLSPSCELKFHIDLQSSMF